MLSLASIVTDHAILQRNKPIRLWGRADSGTVITATLTGCTPQSTPCIGDTWEITLPPLASGEGLTLTVTDGEVILTRKNIALGEVWLLGGQSNMEFALRDEKHWSERKATLRPYDIRLYHVCKRGFLDDQFYKDEVQTQWQCLDPTVMDSWSAIGFYFAEELAEALNCPIGLVNCNYGGTSASAWISRQTLESTAIGKTYLADYDNAMEGLTESEGIQAYNAYLAYYEEWNKRVGECYAENPQIGWSEVLERCGENRYPGPLAPNNPMRPTGLFETMIQRIAPYTLGGVLYYQGESDDHRAWGYATLLESLVKEWRVLFRDESLPFLLAQLPLHAWVGEENNTNWCEIRTAQESVYRSLDHMGLAVLIDCGELNNIHPIDKVTPAHRFFLQAMCVAYGADPYTNTAPMLRTYRASEREIVLDFFDIDHPTLSAMHGSTKGFEVCDEKGEWQRATVYALSLTDSEDCYCYHFLREDHGPVTGLRYAWANAPRHILFRSDNLPLAPFCTSDPLTRLTQN